MTSVLPCAVVWFVPGRAFVGGFSGILGPVRTVPVETPGIAGADGVPPSIHRLAVAIRGSCDTPAGHVNSVEPHLNQGTRIPVSGLEPIEYTASAGALPIIVKRAFTTYE